MYDQHIILDFEMNPVSKGNSKKELAREIIEIGAVKLNNKCEIVDYFSCFVKPQYSSDISSYITKLTGITSADVHKSVSFCEAVEKFKFWIGEGKTRIYSWSDSDLLQLKKECSVKGVQMPDNMKRWMDVQLVFPRLMKIVSRRRKMALKDAATWYGVTVDSRNTHRALYDAEITTELVIPILSGDYKKQIDTLSRNMVREQREEDVVCLGDMFGGVFAQLLQGMNQDLEYAR